jgi:hypothetical protein
VAEPQVVLDIVVQNIYIYIVWERETATKNMLLLINSNIYDENRIEREKNFKLENEREKV